MAEEKKNILTYEGFKKLEDELQNLKASNNAASCVQHTPNNAGSFLSL